MVSFVGCLNCLSVEGKGKNDALGVGEVGFLWGCGLLGSQLLQSAYNPIMVRGIINKGKVIGEKVR